MTHQDAVEIVFRMWLYMLPFASLAMVAGWQDAPKKKTVGRRTKQRPVKSSRKVKVPKAKAWKAAPPLSEWEHRIFTDYIIRRDGHAATNSMPL